MSERRRIMGVDPSLACTGIVVVVEDGDMLTPVHAEVVRSASTAKRLRRGVGVDDAMRAAALAESIAGCLRECRVDVLAVELPSGSQSARAARTAGICIGVLGTVADMLAEQVVWLTPYQCKAAVTGTRMGSKTAIAAGVLDAMPGLADWLDGPVVAQEAISDAGAVVLAAKKVIDIGAAV